MTRRVETCNYLQKHGACNKTFTQMRLNKAVYHFHSKDSLVQCVCLLPIVLHAAFMGMGYQSINYSLKFHQHGVYCV